MQEFETVIFSVADYASSKERENWPQIYYVLRNIHWVYSQRSGNDTWESSSIEEGVGSKKTSHK